MNKLFYKSFKSIYNSLYIIDVGARSGLEDVLRNLEKNLDINIIGFEPEKKAFDKLMINVPERTVYFNVGLFSKKCKKTLYVTRDPGNTSLYKPDYNFLNSYFTKEDLSKLEIVSEHIVDVDTLDNVLESSELNPDFIKLDTEGSEVDILYGCNKFLQNNLLGVESEISYHRLKLSQLTFKDLDNFLDKLDFQLFDLKQRHIKRPIGQEFGMRKGQLMYCDALYFKSIKGLENIVKDKPITYKKHKIINMIILTCSYGYFDYGYEVFYTFKKLFNKKEIESIEKGFKNSKIKYLRFPHFLGRGFIGKIFYKIGVFLGSGYWNNRSAFRYGDDSIGNIDLH